MNNDHLKDHEFTAIVGQAVRGAWEIPPDQFSALPERLIGIVQSGNDRVALKAAKLLVDMNSQNELPAKSESQYGRVVVYIPDNGRGPAPGESGQVVITETEATADRDAGEGDDRGTTE